MLNQTPEKENCENELYSANEVINNLNQELIFLDKIDKVKELKNCTYKSGYISQELYACIDCFKLKNEKEDSERVYAGICVGCAYKCHKDHDIIPLNFKRNFRCDCGNSKFEVSCEFLPNEKDYVNEANVYNHNYEGKFCSCSGEDEGQMIQCLHCEDWYHFDHLNLPEYVNSEEGELICKKCVSSNFSLIQYLDFHKLFPLNQDSIQKIEKNTEEDIKIETLSSGLKFEALKDNDFYENKKRPCPFTESNAEGKRKKVENSEIVGEHNELICKEGYCENFSKMKENNKENNNALLKGKAVSDYDIIVDIKSVIDIMCKCERCSEMYEKNDISYILKSNFCEDLKSRTMVEDKLKEETDMKKEENQNLITDLNNSNFFNIGRVKSLPMEKQIELRESFRSLKEEFVKYTNERVIPGNIITKEFVEEFMENFKRNLANKFPQEESN